MTAGLSANISRRPIGGWCSGLARSARFLAFVATAFAALQGAGAARAATPKGDVSLDGSVTVGDAVLLSRHLRNEVPLSADALFAADVAPLVAGVPAPDGEINAGDLVVLMRLARDELVLPAPPAAPTISTVTPGGSAYATVEGAADPNAKIRIFVEGRLQLETVADATGAYSVLAFLFDRSMAAPNQIEVQSYSDSGGLSDRSATSLLEYVDSIPRTQSGVINDVVSWTPGAGTPYTIDDDLTVDSGGVLVLMPGTRLEFQNSSVTQSGLTVGAKLTVRGGGSLLVWGEDGNLVVLTRDPDPAFADPGPGLPSTWVGIDLQDAGSDPPTAVRFARMELANTAIDVSGPTSVEITESEVLDPRDTGVDIGSSGVVAVRNTTFTNATYPGNGTAIRILGATGEVYVEGNDIVPSAGEENSFSAGIQILSSSATPIELVGNQIVGASLGIQIQGNVTIGSNEITENSIGIAFGGGTATILDNLIADNDMGIRLDEANTVLPTMVLSGNSIYGNWNASLGALANIQVRKVNGPSTANHVLDLRGNYWGTTVRSEIVEGFCVGLPPSGGVCLDVYENTFYPSARRFTFDFSGFLQEEGGRVAAGSDYQLFPFFRLLSVGGGGDLETLDLQQATPINLNFEARISGTYRVLIFAERELAACVENPPCDVGGLAPVRILDDGEGLSNPLAPGAFAITWDGRDENELPTPNEVYTVALENTVVPGATPNVWNPGFASGGQTFPENIQADRDFAPYENEFLVAPWQWLGVQGGRISLTINPGTTLDASAAEFIADRVYLPPSPATVDLVFDGRNPDGTLLSPGSYFIDAPSAGDRNLLEKSIVVTGSTPQIAGPPPGNEVLITPSLGLAYHSYDQAPQIHFCVNQDADVTISVYKTAEGEAPEFLGYAVKDVGQPALEVQGLRVLPADCPFTSVWKGHSEADSLTLLRGAEEFFMFVIDAASPNNLAAKSTYRGVFRVRR